MEKSNNTIEVTIDSTQLEKSLLSISQKVTEALHGIDLSIQQTISSGNGILDFIGSASNAVNLLKNSGDALQIATSLVTTSLTSLWGVAGVTVTAIAALGAALSMFSESLQNSPHEEFMKAQEEKTASIQAEKDKWNELVSSQASSMNANLAQIDNTAALSNELRGLVSVNGEVDEQNKGRVNFILGQLNEAFGTEYKLIDGIIQNYESLSSSMENNIAKQRAKIILDSQEEVYAEALTNRKKALIDLHDIETQKTAKEMEIMQLKNEITNATSESDRRAAELKKITLDTELAAVQTTYDEKKAVVEGCTTAIMEYENNQALFLSENAEDLAKINEDITSSNLNRNSTSLASLGETAIVEQEQLDILNQSYSDHEDAKVKTQIDAAQARLDAAINNGIALAEQNGINHESELASVDEFIAQKMERNALLAESEDGMRSEEYLKNQEQIAMLQGLKTDYNNDLLLTTDELHASLNEKTEKEKLTELTSIEDQYGKSMSHYGNFVNDKLSQSQQLKEELGKHYDADKQRELDALEQQKAEGLVSFGSYVNAKLDKASYLRDHMNDENSGITQDMVDEAEKQAQEALTEYDKVASNVLSSWDDLEPETKKSFQNMMSPMMREMEGKKKSLWDKANEIAGGIIGSFNKVFDIASPSKKMKKIFRYVLEGAEIGLDDKTPELLNKSNDIATNIVDVFTDMNKHLPSDELANDLDMMFQQVAVDDWIKKLENCIQTVHMRLSSDVNECASLKFMNYNHDKKEPIIKGTFKGNIENHLEIDGRETAIQLTPFISEELAFHM